MASDRYIMSESNSGSISSRKTGSGCHVSTAVGFLLTFLAIVVAVGVGLIVHFAEKDKEILCKVDIPEAFMQPQADRQNAPTASLQTQAAPDCREKILNGGQGLCELCPEVTSTKYTSPPTTTAPPDERKSFRLPNTVKPLHYDLELKPNLYGDDPNDFTFEGHVVITLECMEPTSEVMLHVRDLAIFDGDIVFGSKVKTGEEPRYLSHSEDKENEFLVILLDGQLQKGRQYTLSIRFIGPLRDDLRGFYLSQYQRGDKTVYLATSQFESTSARKAFPCFDEPALKATFSTTLVRKSHLKSISNMPIIRQEERGDGFIADVHQKTPVMSTYLLAFIVCDFESIHTVSKNGFQYRVWARPEAMEQTRFALDTGSKIITYFEEYFNLSFPLPKQDMIAIPDFAVGAMENWGLITYREHNLLYDETEPSEKSKQRVALTVAHELAHQWFGDLVTLAWWDDLWLNEGFADFGEHMGQDFLFPQWQMFDVFVVSQTQKVFEVDGHVASHPIFVPNLRRLEDIESLFDTISYNKGAACIRMLQVSLGERTFQRGLQRYLKAHKYSSANHDDLWAALAEQAQMENKDLDVKEMMNTWILQQNYPVVMVTYDVDSIKLTQQRFLSNPDAKDPGTYPALYDYKWHIPFTFTTSNDQNFDVTDKDVHWMPREVEEVFIQNADSLPDTSDDSGWLLGNIRQYGVYRVNYDDRNWKALLRQLKVNHDVIHVTNRAQLIDDAWNLASAGMLDTDIALGTLEYLEAEMDYLPWAAASKQIDLIQKRLMKTELYGAFQKFLQDKISQQFRKLGLNDKGDNFLESSLRSELADLSCKWALSDCVQSARTMFQAWRSSPSSKPIPPEVRHRVLCTGISYGSVSDWEFVYARYVAETNTAEKVDLMKALSCSKEPWILSNLLLRCLRTDGIRRADVTSVIFEVTQNPIGQPLAWDLLKDQWTFIYTQLRSGQAYMRRMVMGATDTFATDAEIQELKNFISSQADLGSADQMFHQALEDVEVNRKWMQNSYPKVREWLRKLGYLETTSTSITKAPVDIRLPGDVLPRHYDLELQPLIYEGDPANFNFLGSVAIQVECVQTTSTITLHVLGQTIEPSSLNLQGVNVSMGTRPRYKSHRFDKSREFLIVELDEPLTVGQWYRLEMRFKGHLLPNLRGLYVSSYLKNGKRRYLAATHFETMDARRAFPSFDEPALKATFKVTLVRKKSYTSASNMPIERSVPRPDDFVADVYYTTPKMSTYLMAFLVSDFSMKSDKTTNNVTIEVWSREDVFDETDYALSVGLEALTFYEDYFKIRYPLPKQALAAIPDFLSGAMENWGLITFRESRMLYKDEVSSLGNKRSATLTITHELSHMWFGDLVTPVWWDDIWLNEGFARFMEYLATDHLYPDWEQFDDFVYSQVHSTMTSDGLISSHPIYAPVHSREEISGFFDSISYGKGACIIRMLRFCLGEDTFRQGLVNYLNSRKYSNANHKDLWVALSEQARLEKKNIDVANFMDTWILQMNYPVVMVKRLNQTSVRLTQQRYLKDPTAKDPQKYKSPFGYKWVIPFTWTSSTTPNFNVTDADIIWLDKAQEVIVNGLNLPSSGGWILGNVREYGFYRVNYETENWLALINQLKSNHEVIHSINRAQIINDAWNLARAGLLDQDIALQSVEYFDQEQQFVPLKEALNMMAFVRNMLSRRALYGAFQNFMKDKMTPVFKVAMAQGHASAAQGFYWTTAVSAACIYDVTECVKMSQQYISQWMRTPTNNSIPTDIRSTVYSTVVRTGDVTVWNFMEDRYVSEKSPSEKARLRYALTSTTEPWLLVKLLEKSLDPTYVRPGDFSSIISGVASNPVGTDLAWRFVTDNWDTLFSLFGDASFLLPGIASSVTGMFNTEGDLAMLETFINNHPDLGSATQTFQQALEKTASNAQWTEKNYPILESWLQRNGYSV